MPNPKLYLIKGSNSDGDRYEFAEPPVLSFHQGEYQKNWNGENVFWKWRDVEPILLTCSAIAFVSGVLMGMVFG